MREFSTTFFGTFRYTRGSIDRYAALKAQSDTQNDRTIINLIINSQVSVFGGPAWTWSEERQAYYLHQFAPEQPDLNFENKKVVKAMQVRAIRETVVIKTASTTSIPDYSGKRSSGSIERAIHQAIVTRSFGISSKFTLTSAEFSIDCRKSIVRYRQSLARLRKIRSQRLEKWR